MKRYRFTLMLGLVLVLALVLAACGGTDTPAPTDEPAPAVEEPAVEEPAVEEPAEPDTMEEVSLRWRTRPDNQEEADLYQGISDGVDLPGVTLVYEPGSTETAGYQDVLKTELASGTAPDVFWIPGTDVADFATRGLLYDLRSLADATADYSDDDFYPGPMFHLTFDPESGQAGPTLWGLPRDVSTFALYLNLDLIAEAGADDPRELEANGEWTWDKFLEVSEAVDALGTDVHGYGGSAWWGPYGVWINAAGGNFFNADRTACALDTPEALAGLTFAQDLYASGVAVPYGEDSEPPFRAGNVAMFQNGRWATPGIRTVEFDWDVVGLPTGPTGTPGNWLFWGGYVVNANTEHPEEAWQLVQALTTAETQGTVAALGANIPSRVSQEALDAFLTFTPPANNQAFLDGLANSPTAEGPLWAGSWPEFGAVMDAAVSSLLSGQSTIDDFANSVCDEANKAFTVQPAAAEPDTMEEVSLRWRTRPDNQEEADLYQGISDGVDLPGVTLVYEPGSTETAGYQDVLKTELASGTAPDVFWIPGTDVADFATRGLLYDLRSLADATADYSDDDFYPGPMFHLTFDPESGQAGPTLWGLPRDVSTFALYLNLDLIAEAGADDPRELEANGEWTWDKFLEVSEAVDALGTDVHGYGGSAWWGPYGVWINAAGGNFFNADRTACALDTPEALAGLTFAQDLYASGVAVPYGEDSEPPFRAGNVAMFQNGRWATPGIRTVEFDWDVVGLPTGPTGTPGNWLFWGGYVVNANTEHPEEAWQLVQALTTAETQGTVAALGANIPSRVSQEALDAFLTFTPPANNQAFLDGLANSPTAEGPLWAGSWPEFGAVMDAAVSSLLSGQSTIDDFANSVCDEANKAF